jgi:predicted transcriptional regulator of viral defense system
MNADTTKTQSDRALAFLAERGMARLHEFIDAGVKEETVARLVRRGKVVRLARGLYQLPDADLQAEHSLAEAAKLVPKGVICLISALQFHRMTVQLPPFVWMAIDRTTRKPKVAYPRIRFVRFGAKALTLGVEEHVIESVNVRIYDPAKTVVDCFRYRNKIGLDVALEGLRGAVRQRRARPDDIVRYAKACRAWTVIQPYLESVVSDAA